MFIQAIIYTLGQGLAFNVVLPLWYSDKLTYIE